MIVVKYRKIFFAISGIIVAASIGAIAIFGLNFGIEFTGGDIAKVVYEQRPAKSVIADKIQTFDIGEYSLRASGEKSFILRTRALKEKERAEILSTLKSTGGNVESFNSVGPTIGKELRNKAWIAILIVILSIILFVAFTFRQVSKPVSSWKYGLIAIVALMHDVIVPVGLFAVLGHFLGAEVNVLFVMAILAILGYSVNDTIVVFDRVRENLRENEKSNRKEDFEITVGKSLNQTFVRSVNTSLTTLLALLALFFIGSSVTQDFALVLIAGVIAGTYSSICLATPLLVTMQRWAQK